MLKFSVAGGLLVSLAMLSAAKTTVVDHVASPQTEFGAAEIRRADGQIGLGTVSITLALDLLAESFRIRKAGAGYVIEGGDANGAMFGALDFAEQISLTGDRPQERTESPSLPLRALKFNLPLPGTGYLSEEDLANNQWFWDLEYWRKFLDMMARNRYNALTFWSAHPFDRMVRVAKYPEATDVSAAELDRNIAFFRKLFQMAADRGVGVYLVTWNIHVPEAFAKAHQIPSSAFDSPLVRDYQREAIKALFATYPQLTGLGTTVGERMGHMSIAQKLDWIADTYFAALRQIGRPVPFILRYWQSEPEAMAAMLDAVHYPGPMYLDIKFNGEKMYSSTKPHVLDGKWMALAHGRYRLLWHLRNDDIFMLRWGDPDFVREALHNAGGADSAGFIEGSEIFVPGVDRIHTDPAKAHVDWQYEFEKHWFRYLLWGRLGYRVEEPDETWRGHFRVRFGAAGNDIYEAMRQAGKIVPLITSYHWNYMNGDWYPEGGIGSWNTSYEQPRHNYRRASLYQDVRTYIFNNTIDEGWANIPQFVAGSKAPGPLEAADRLEQYGRNTLAAMDRARPLVERGQKEFACTDLDLQAVGYPLDSCDPPASGLVGRSPWTARDALVPLPEAEAGASERARAPAPRGAANCAGMSQVDTQLQASAQLGLYYAEKLRGAAHLARYLFGGPDKEQKESVAHLESALEAWRGVVAATENHYVAHEIWLFGQFHWKQYLPEVENDIRIARDARRFAPGSTLALDGMHEWLEYTYGLLGHKPVDAINTAAPVAITPPMARHEDPTAPLGYYFSAAADLVRVGNTITGAKPSASGANSATFAVELPADGEYSVAMDCWWPKAAGSLSVFVDESATASDGYTLRVSTKTASGAWTRMTLGHTVLLGAGGHTVRIFAPSPGVRIGRVVVNWVGKP